MIEAYIAMAEGWGATDPHDLNLTHDSEEGAQPSYGPASDSTPPVQRSYRPATTSEKGVRGLFLTFLGTFSI